MSYAALMVHLGGERDWSKRVHLAADLAARFNSVLIGTAGWQPMPAFALDDESVADKDTYDAEQRRMNNLLLEMEQQFRSSTRNISAVEWRGMLDYPRDLVPREARAADLIIVGQERVPNDPYFALNPGVTLLRAGRPVLVVPPVLGSLTAQRILIAWKDTREARRAVRDALPLLQKAAQVIIAEVNEPDAQDQSEKGIEDVIVYLKRHKVAVGFKAFLQTKRPAAEELLLFAKDESADLIVAGGYGHSRLGEWLFGGVTRDLLAKSEVCCLFSH